jgi:hypothetical protein
MDLNNTEMQEAVERIAQESPRVLLKALRDSGFWIYCLNKEDINDALSDSPQDDLSPVTSDDMDYVNMRDNKSGVISQDVNYENVTRNIIMEIRDYRNAKNNIQ